MNSEEKTTPPSFSDSLLHKQKYPFFTPEDYQAFFEAFNKEMISSSTDAEGNLIHVTDKFVEISKYTREELIGQNHRILKSGYHSKEFYENLWKTISSGNIWRGEIKNRAKDGSYYWFDTIIIPLLGADKKPQKYISIRYLITDQKLLECIEHELQYARILIEASLDPLVTISAEGKIMDINEATVKVTGIPRDKLIGTDFFNYFTEPEKAREGYKEAFAKGSVANYPLTIRHQGGHLTDVLYNASVYKDTQGNVLGVFAAARDITAQKKIEHELVEQHHRELQRLVEFEKFQKITVDRELRMIELKNEIMELKKESKSLKPK